MAKVLIDTNILVYAMDSSSRFNNLAFGLFQKIQNKEFQPFISERSLYEIVAVLTNKAFAGKI